MRRWVFISVSALLLAACSFSADTQAAEQAVTVFHAAFNSSRFDDIYSASDAKYKSGSSRADSTKFLAAVRTKLGRFQSGKTLGSNDNVNPGGHFVTLTREAQFERGKAEETFVVRIAGSRAILVGYNINSNTLVTG
jgi:opacity protein-like surface antigen